MNAQVTPAIPGRWAASERECAAALQALSCMDLTDLSENCTAAQIDALCLKARTGWSHDGRSEPQRVAAVCVWPEFVAQARAALPATVSVAAVVNFPSGDQGVEAVRYQVAQIRARGGQEVDCVLPWKALAAGNEALVQELLLAVRRASEGLVLKMILETGQLQSDALVQRASVLALESGVDFLKTSTGKTPVGATLAATDIMLRAMSAHDRSERLGLKPSGGIKTVADAAAYMDQLEQHWGEEALNPRRFRIGASSLYEQILRVLQGQQQSTNANGGY